jgi:hypothetical protein
VGLVFLSQFLPSLGIPSPAISPPVITSEVPNLSSPSQPPQSPPPPATLPPETVFRQSPKTTTFAFFMGRDVRTMSFTTFGGLSDFFSNKSHSYHYDPDNGVIVDLLENEVRMNLCDPSLR